MTKLVIYEFLDGFYIVIQHQIILKLIEYYPGVVDCQFELKLVCGNREFLFRAVKINDKTGHI